MKKALLGLGLAVGLTVTSFGQQIPRPPGPWQAMTSDKKVLKLDQFKGKVVVLAFLLTTCPHCQKYSGVLNLIQKEFAPQGVQVVASTIGPAGLASNTEFVERFSPQFPIGAMDQETLNAFGQWGPKRTYMPQVFFLDKAGVIQAQFMGSDGFFEGDTLTNTRDAVKRMLLKTAPAPKKK
jgi:peroxiredoxin